MTTNESLPNESSKKGMLPLKGELKGESSKSFRPAVPNESTNLEHVNDVMLSIKMRELERRYVRFEEKLFKELSHLRSEMTGRMDSLERHLKSEVEAMSVRLTQETQDRQTTDKQLTEEAYSAKTNFNKDLEGLRIALGKSDREFRQALLDVSKNLTSELHRVQEELTSEMTEEVHALEDGKVERSNLAAILNEVIVRLNTGQDGGTVRSERK